MGPREQLRGLNFNMKSRSPDMLRSWRPWWAALTPIALAACTGSVSEKPRLESPYALTPDFTEVAVSPNEPQVLIEQELEANEIEQFRAFVANIPAEYRRAFLSVISQMDEGLRGVTIVRHILPEPAYGQKFAELTHLVGEEFETAFAAELSSYFVGTWFGIKDAVNDGMDDAKLAEMIRFFAQEGICIYDEEDFAGIQEYAYQITNPIMLCARD